MTQEENCRQLLREQRLEQVNAATAIDAYRIAHTIYLAETHPGGQRLDPRQAVVVLIVGPPYTLMRHVRPSEGIHCAIQPVAMQLPQFARIALPSCAGRRISLDNLQPITTPLKSDAVIPTESTDAAAHEFQHLDLRRHERLKFRVA